jgi:hypothetical protein
MFQPRQKRLEGGKICVKPLSFHHQQDSSDPQISAGLCGANESLQAVSEPPIGSVASNEIIMSKSAQNCNVRWRGEAGREAL